VLPIGWVEAQGSQTAAHLAQTAVAMGAGTGKACQSKEQEDAVGNTVVPEEGAESSSSAVGFHQYSQVV
jgi:hypothetical protein